MQRSTLVLYLPQLLRLYTQFPKVHCKSARPSASNRVVKTLFETRLASLTCDQSRPKHEKSTRVYPLKSTLPTSYDTFDDRFGKSTAVRVQPCRHIMILFFEKIINSHLHPIISTFPRSHATADSIFGISGSRRVQPCGQIMI